ncbi:protein-(glutamine-N5) methyltransferase, release factor-specific [Pseudoalteromonas sp. A601]|uniref:peptide chain release factor N(5)-glutamine methyltransferase n=1 Tax=Pseudoalteromonas sp. A601 TaxID=1967839 RepID=UPI000B3C6068|nr:peptide chain release factor N(5)-glutamine methyltransferase [Pseudoalteromonas sp. A601]OUS68579.1 protein-(glutamine-N5) methyltransferase, release factor-specific [Pseudoalteromonas sp. A601]
MTDTVESAIHSATLLLQNSTDSAKLDAQVLLLEVLNKPRSYLFSWPEKQLTVEQQQLFDSYCQRRLNGEPIAHITGTREFWSLPLQVNATTLIPRPDTETLVEVALNLPLKEDAKVLDLGTGTGAIALALAFEKANWQITGVDRIAQAVALSTINKQRLGLQQVTFLQSNWFSEVSNQKFDLIVSNPPYIEHDDEHLTQGDVRFEPLSALVADDDGMADIKHIITQARNYLAPNGYLIFEHGYQQSTKVHSFFAQMAYTNILTVKDLANNDRVTFAQWPK